MIKCRRFQQEPSFSADRTRSNRFRAGSRRNKKLKKVPTTASDRK